MEMTPEEKARMVEKLMLQRAAVHWEKSFHEVAQAYAESRIPVLTGIQQSIEAKLKELS